MQHSLYGGEIALLKLELETRVRWCIDNPKESLSKVDLELEFLVNGVLLANKPKVGVSVVETEIDPNYNTVQYTTSIDVGIHNLMNRMISHEAFDLALVTQFEIKGIGKTIRSATRQPNGRNISNLTKVSSMFSDSWESLPVVLEFSKKPSKGHSTEIILRLFTEVGVKDYPFVLEIEGLFYALY